ncbi:class I adenylate-forming enzyme family protein [Pontibacillus salicampi]|uniref:Class I adenylate-forming enzyme family protein n=1 Tax=Pontibacillus salicampi TaxID=1449801 RepID=A0ABV6LQJ2_9BACI
MNKTVVESLQEAANLVPNTVFLYEGNQNFTFQDMDQLSDTLASSLYSLGLKQGDHIAINALNQSEWLLAFFAAAKLGITVVTLNVRYRDNEIEYMVNNADVKAIISVDALGDFNYVSFYQRLEDRLPSVEHYIFIGDNSRFTGSYSFQQLMERKKELMIATPTITPEEVLLMIYTSGTTGKPKGTMITHKSILASAKAQVDHFQVTDNDLAIGALPFNHVGGITCTVMVALVSRSKVALVPSFHPKQVLNTIEQYQATILGGVPTMYYMLIGQEEVSSYDVSSLRLCIVGGSNVEPGLADDMVRVFPTAHLVNLYGLSETSGACILSNFEDSVERIGESIGVIIGDFEARVEKDNHFDDSPGEVGELMIRGDCVAKGYYNMEDATQDTFTEDGWLCTGDMVSIEEGGYVYFKGRKKEMYVTGGFNVFPVEIENVLTKHPKVALAAGIGVPDKWMGEIGRYYIVPASKAKPTAEELTDYCLQHVSDYKVPKEFIFVEEVPMTPAGKIQKAKLKEAVVKGEWSSNGEKRV